MAQGMSHSAGPSAWASCRLWWARESTVPSLAAAGMLWLCLGAAGGDGGPAAGGLRRQDAGKVGTLHKG